MVGELITGEIVEAVKVAVAEMALGTTTVLQFVVVAQSVLLALIQIWARPIPDKRARTRRR
jgi:hypothetical protein